MRLGHQFSAANNSSKIWVFAVEELQIEIVMDTAQMITMKVHHQSLSQDVLVTFLFASCDQLERGSLWDTMEHVAIHWQLPWLIGGDFNFILAQEEKIGGLPVYHQEIEELYQCINICGLEDMGYEGSTFTWWNGRHNKATIFKRLDRFMCNQEMRNLFSQIKVKHLIKKGSDHSLLQLELENNQELIIKPFRFLNFWVKHPNFREVVEENWNEDAMGSPFIIV